MPDPRAGIYLFKLRLPRLAPRARDAPENFWHKLKDLQYAETVGQGMMPRSKLPVNAQRLWVFPEVLL